MKRTPYTGQDPAQFFIPPVCAYTPQVPRLFSQSLKENILFGLHRKKEEIYSSIHNAVLEEDIDSLESGIDTVVGTRGVKLSGGQIQRSAVAPYFFLQLNFNKVEAHCNFVATNCSKRKV